MTCKHMTQIGIMSQRRCRRAAVRDGYCTRHHSDYLPGQNSGTGASPKDVLLALAERCEKATGPDRELDWDIYWHTLRHKIMTRDSDWPAFTASLDAALTLVPPLDEKTRPFKITMGVSENGLRFQVIMENWRWGKMESHPRCASFELALCAAALRARGSSL